MIRPREIEHLGHQLAKLNARYSAVELQKILRYAYVNRIKGGSLRAVVKLLREFATEIEQSSSRSRRKPPQGAITSARNGDR